MDWLLEYLNRFTSLDYGVFLFNVLLFLFARPLSAKLQPSLDEVIQKRRIYALRLLNTVLFALYFVAAFFISVARQISQTGLTLLVAYLVYQLLHYFFLRRFGKEKEVEGKRAISASYQSEMLALLGLVVTVIIVFLAIINIWQITGWLEATSVIGGILLLLYSTRDVWVPDSIHGLILLYHGNIEPGSVVRLDEYQLLGVVLRITPTQTLFRDLRQRHEILLPNTKLRTTKIDVLTNCPSRGLTEYADFNIGYGLASDTVVAFLEEVWERACEAQKAINPESKPQVRLVNNGDHAVTWRLYYVVGNVYKILQAGFAIQRAAYDLSLEHGIGLNTPLTHQALPLPVEPEQGPRSIT